MGQVKHYKGKFAKISKGLARRKNGYYKRLFVKCVKKTGKWRGKKKNLLDLRQ